MDTFMEIMSNLIQIPGAKEKSVENPKVRKYRMSHEAEKISETHINQLSEMVNCYGFQSEKTYNSALEELPCDKIMTLKENLYAMAQAMIWYFGTKQVWTDQRNESSVKRCRMITSDTFTDCTRIEDLPAFAVMDSLEIKEQNCIYWESFAKMADMHMHRTNLQTALGFCIWCLTALCPDDSMDKTRQALELEYGEKYYRFRII